MRIHLRYTITNHNLHRRVSIYLSEDDRWYVICVDLNDLHATTAEFVPTLDKALEFVQLEELRSCLEDRDDAGPSQSPTTTSQSVTDALSAG